MSEDKSYCPKSETRDIIISDFMKGDSSSFFYDVSNTREDGLVLLLDKNYNAHDAKRMCAEHSRGGEVKVRWEAIASPRSYLDWFSGWGERKHHVEFLDAREALRRNLQQEGYRGTDIFEGIALKEVGRIRNVVDMAHIDQGVLSLYSIMMEFDDPGKKRKGLRRASRFFKERFGDVLAVAGCFLATYEGRGNFDIEEFVTDEWLVENNQKDV